MEFQLDNAILAGFVGTAVMTAVMYMGYMMNMRMDMPMMLGTMFLSKGPAAWALGVMIHFLMGATFLWCTRCSLICSPSKAASSAGRPSSG